MKFTIRKRVFIPAFSIVVIAAIIGLINNELLISFFMKAFENVYKYLGWLFQLVILLSVLVVIILSISPKGKILIGGKDAKPKYSTVTWFAMSLTGGLTSGLVALGVAQPVIFSQNIWGELTGYGIATGSDEAVMFGMARSLHEWTLAPYALYGISGIAIAYMCFNKHKKVSISSSLIPLFGDKICDSEWSSVIDGVSILSLALATVGTLGSFLSLSTLCLRMVYKVPTSVILMFILMLVVTCIYLSSSLSGVDKGIKIFARINTFFYIFLMIFVFIYSSPKVVITTSSDSIIYWMQKALLWAVDYGKIGGEALVKWWTVYNWAFWIAYAPVTGVFLAQLSYGRTVREFLLVNWLAPSVFVGIWFNIFGSIGMEWQRTGIVDIAASINEGGTYAGIWAFLDNLPLKEIIIPVALFTMLISFTTGADNSITVISALCVDGKKIGDEAPAILKCAWGIAIGLLSFLLMAFAAGSKGNDGVRYMVVAVGGILLFLFILQLISVIKMFFIDKAEE